MKENLDFKKVINNKKLLCEVSYNYILNNFSNDEVEDFLVCEIDPNYMDGTKLFSKYDTKNLLGVNCLIVECKRNSDVTYAALLVPTGYKYNMSSTIRKYTNSRIVSVAPLDIVLRDTKMEYGSINPIGLPHDYKIFIDSKILDSELIICGSGLQKSKLSFPSKYLLKLNNAVILDNIAK